MLILNSDGIPILEELDGIRMPANYSFACINDYVHSSDADYECLQYLALGMACKIEELEKLIKASI